jgi:hypothetical protein
MSNPILAAVERDLGVAWHDITSHLHPHPYHDNQPARSGPAERTTTMSLAETIRTDLTDGVTYVKGWVERMEANAGPVLETVDKVEQNKVLQALETAALGPEGEALVIDVIGRLAAFTAAPQPAQPAAAADTPADSTPAETAPSTAAEPSPAA